MSKQSERCNLLKKNFMPLRKQGKSIAEISQMHNVSSATVYNILQGIADENHVSRESLLYQPHSPHIRNCVSSKNQSEDSNVDELLKDVFSISEAFNSILATIETVTNELGEQ